jgi:hypothetical protein
MSKAALCAKLRELIEESHLPIVIFSERVLGRDQRTLQRYLAGEPMPTSVQYFIRAMRSVECADDGSITVQLQFSPPNPRWNWWRLRKNRGQYAGFT